MVFRVILFLWEFLMDVLAVSRLSDEEKELEILLLRQQLRIVGRRQERGPRIPRSQKVPLAMLAVRLKERARNGRAALETSVRLFRPATVIGWHQAIVRRKWTYQQGKNRDDHRLMQNWSAGPAGGERQSGFRL
jgi:urease gamma subunit